jgi:2-hydroxy-3-oxopropionate reductase
MGGSMARNLSGKFPGVHAYDTDPVKLQNLVSCAKPGAILPAESIQDVGRKSDIVFLSLPDSTIVKSVILGERGLGTCMKSGGIIIDASTSDAAVVIEIASVLAKKGIRFLDSPVSGGERAATNATLSFMVGGEESVFNDCLAYLKAMGASVIRTGGTGSGQVAKCVNQMIVGATFAAIAEAFALGSKTGIDPSSLYNAIKDGWAGSKVLDVAARDIISREFNPGGTIDMICKDLGYVLSLSRNQVFPAPVTSLVHEIFMAGRAAGDGKRSQAAIVKLWEK